MIRGPPFERHEGRLKAIFVYRIWTFVSSAIDELLLLIRVPVPDLNKQAGLTLRRTRGTLRFLHTIFDILSVVVREIRKGADSVLVWVPIHPVPLGGIAMVTITDRRRSRRRSEQHHRPLKCTFAEGLTEARSVVSPINTLHFAASHNLGHPLVSCVDHCGTFFGVGSTAPLSKAFSLIVRRQPSARYQSSYRSGAALGSRWCGPCWPWRGPWYGFWFAW